MLRWLEEVGTLRERRTPVLSCATLGRSEASFQAASRYVVVGRTIQPTGLVVETWDTVVNDLVLKGKRRSMTPVSKALALLLEATVFYMLMADRTPSQDS